MATETIPLLGGKSVHCINEQQMAEALRLVDDDPVSSPLIKSHLEKIEAELSRNEQAALAFILIRKLKMSSPL